MMLLLIFIVLLIATLLAWFNHRKIALTIVVINLLISIIAFILDMTTRLNLVF